MNASPSASSSARPPASPAPRAPSATATLLVEVGDRLTTYAIGPAGATIGRDPRSAVPIDHPTVSRAHARIDRSRDGGGWRLVDLNSQNGSTLGETRIVGDVPLPAEAALRIGRVRAWFFAADAPPRDWRPTDGPQLGGKLIRCRCGHIGWAPTQAGGVKLTCGTCGRDVAGVDATPAPPNVGIAAAPAVIGTCAACHTELSGSDELHACSDCGATTHADCWTENRGCPVYGCAQVNILETRGPSEPAADATADADGLPLVDEDHAPSPMAQSAAQLGLLTLVGLPAFGVPAIIFGAYRLVAGGGRPRLIDAAAAFAGGCVGFAASAWWWLDAFRR